MTQIALRITVLDPPAGVAFRMQRGRSELVEPASSKSRAITFDFDVRVAERQGQAPPRFLGEFTQGPPASRFVYVNSGKRAGQPDSQWDRRAKIPLAGVTWALIEKALATPGAVIEARIAGTGRDGGPACATVPVSWQLR